MKEEEEFEEMVMKDSAAENEMKTPPAGIEPVRHGALQPISKMRADIIYYQLDVNILSNGPLDSAVAPPAHMR